MNRKRDVQVDSHAFVMVRGYKLILTNPYELLLADSRGSTLALRDDDLENPILPDIFRILKGRRFTVAQMLDTKNTKSRESDKHEILNLLVDQGVIVGAELDQALRDIPKLRVSLMGAPDLLQKLLNELSPVLDPQVVIPLGEGNAHAITDLQQLEESRVIPINPAKDGQRRQLDDVFGDEELLLYMGTLDTRLLEDINRVSLTMAKPLIPLIVLDHRSAIVGPVVIPGRTACLRELLLWMMNADIIPQEDPLEHISPLETADLGQPVLHKPLEHLVFGFFIEMIVDYSRTKVTNHLPTFAGKAIFVDLDRRIISMEHVLKVPGCDVCNTLRGTTYSEEVIPKAYVYQLQQENERP